jgi:excinuclease UvrABC nuclease subunit
MKTLEKQMQAAAQSLDFEKAAKLRDRIKKIRENDLLINV